MGKKWVVGDRYGNRIYLTHERWQHTIENHPEMKSYSDYLKETIKTGKRYQDPLDPRKYRYVKYFEDLVWGNNHIVSIVLFKIDIDKDGNTVENNFVLTAYQKSIK